MRKVPARQQRKPVTRARVSHAVRDESSESARGIRNGGDDSIEAWCVRQFYANAEASGGLSEKELARACQLPVETITIILRGGEANIDKTLIAEVYAKSE